MKVAIPAIFVAAILYSMIHRDVSGNRQMIQGIMEQEQRQQQVLDRLDEFRAGAYQRHERTNGKLDKLLAATHPALP